MCATVRDIDSEMLYLALSHLIIMLPVFRNVFFNIFSGSLTLLILSLWLWLGRRSLKSVLNGWKQQGRSHYEFIFVYSLFQHCKILNKSIYFSFHLSQKWTFKRNMNLSKKTKKKTYKLTLMSKSSLTNFQIELGYLY